MLGFIDGSTGNKNSQPKLLTYPKSQEDISLWPNATLEIAHFLCTYMWKVNVLFGKLSSLRRATGMFCKVGQDVFGL